MSVDAMFDGVAWDQVGMAVVTQGWARLVGAIAPDVSAALSAAAPGPWHPLPEIEAGVRQAGTTCHSDVEGGADVLRSFAAALCAGLDRGTPAGAAQLPAFNHAEWCRAYRGETFITPHRDPDTAGGVIAILTIQGAAIFRVWPDDVGADDTPRPVEQWETLAGDVALLRGGGWPYPTSRCPVHEAESPPGGERTTLTLRHNKGGFGADYFG